MNEAATSLLDAERFPALSLEQFQAVLARWQEPHRRWHGRKHLVELLSAIENDNDLIEADREMLRYAALFHDAVYDPLGSENEEASARLAEEFLPRYARLSEVVAVILATKSHLGESPLIRKFNDWDCAILREKAWDKLVDYERGIAFEYRQVDPAVYRRERSKFLGASAETYRNPLLARLALEVVSG